jgi:thiol-disulfide isomerase/thioredoxin
VEHFEQREQGGGGGGGGGFHGAHFNMQDIFANMFGGGRGGRGGSRGGESGGGSNGQFHFSFGGDDEGEGGGNPFANLFGGFGKRQKGQQQQQQHQQQQHRPLFTGEHSNVTLLDKEAFKNEVLHSNKAWLIMFFSNGCSHCHAFAAEYEKLAGKLHNIVRVGAIDCESGGRKACKGVEGYPEFRLFVSEEDDDGEERSTEDAIPYKGPRDSKRLGNWVIEKLPHNVVRLEVRDVVFFACFVLLSSQLQSFADYKREFEDGKAFLKLPTCILVSKKTSVPPYFASVSREFPKEYDFAFVSAAGKEAKQTMEALGVKESELPVMLVRNFVIPGARTEKLSSAELSYERMSEFLLSYSTAMKQVKQGGLKKKVHKHEEDVSHELTSANWDELCPIDAPFLCVVGIHVDGKQETMTELAQRFLKDRVRFMHVADAGEAAGVVALLRGAASAPSLVVVNRKKSKWTVGDLEHARVFLETVLSGSGKFTEQQGLK